MLSKTNTLAGGLASEDMESMAQDAEDDLNKDDDEVELDAEAKEEKKQKRRVRINY